MRLALLGYGTVGQGVADILARRGPAGLEISSVLVRDPAKRRDIPAPAPVTTSLARAVAGADVIVDVAGEVDQTFPVVRDALAGGVHLVTASKALVSAHLEELTDAAARGGAQLRYEAAVVAGVPVVAELLSQRRTGRITRIEGIVNGSCNFVLSQMAAGTAYDAAVAAATRLGYLEEDPTADLAGHDAQRKLRILASLAFDRPVLEGDVTVAGIDAVTADDVADAAARGAVVKQVALAELTHDGTVSAHVGPREVPAGSLLGSLTGVTNGVTMTHEHLGELTLIGPGAGRYETANAVVTDLYDLG